MTEQVNATIPPFVNRLMSGVLRSPVHGLVSRSIMLLSFTGRVSGKIYKTPVSYMREGDVVTAFTHANWWRNLVGGAPVSVSIKNQEYKGWVEPIAEDKQAIAQQLQFFLNQVRFDARYYQVAFDENGQPNWHDVQQAAENAVMLKIRLNHGS